MAAKKKASKALAKTASETTKPEVGTLIPQPNGRGALLHGNPGNKGGGRPKEVFRRRIKAALVRGKVTKYLRECLDGEHGPAAYFAALTYSSDRTLGKVPTKIEGGDEPLHVILHKG